jgi:hypothetical protein
MQFFMLIHFSLRAWYTAVGRSKSAESFSRASTNSNVPLYTFREATDARLGEKMDTWDPFTVVATIKRIEKDNFVYMACPVDSCRKKVNDTRGGNI